MIQQLKPEVQTREYSPLAELLRRDYLPPDRIGGIVRRPAELLPSRWEIVDYVVAKYGYCPSPELDIEYRTIFYRVTVPTSGKLYVDCAFKECDFEIPNAPYAVCGSVDPGSPLWAHAFRHGYATLLNNVTGLR